jgi:toxin ParE1/3/4
LNYRVVRTDTADALIRKIILHVAEQFDEGTALEKLDELEKSIILLSDNPYMGEIPRYSILRRQGYRVLILEKDLVFYKIDEKNKLVTIYAVVDQRQDYMKIIRGL